MVEDSTFKQNSYLETDEPTVDAASRKLYTYHVVKGNVVLLLYEKKGPLTVAGKINLVIFGNMDSNKVIIYIIAITKIHQKSKATSNA